MEIDFNIPVNQIHLGDRVPEFRSFGPILNCYDADLWLQEQKKLIGWTYSVSLLTIQLTKFERLIAGRSFPGLLKPKIRSANNIHAKCYISKTSALLGSQNLTAPTIEDLSILIKDKKILSHLRSEFERQWKALS